jgi:adenine-specific DNA-methyltransferase
MDDMFEEWHENEDIRPAIKKIAKIPFGGYTGNKRKLLSTIWKAMEDEGIEFNSVFDSFGGSCVFSLFMKYMGKKVVCNDFLSSSYLSSHSMIENPGCFLTYDEFRFVIGNDPKMESADGFVYNNFKDKRFTESECIQLDIFRKNIDLLGTDVDINIVGNKNTELLDMKKRSFLKFFKSSDSIDKFPAKLIDEKDDYSSLKFSEDRRLSYGKAFFLRNIEYIILKNCFLGGRYNNGQVIADLAHRQKHDKHKGKKIKDVDFVKELILDFSTQKYSDIFNNYEECHSLNYDIIYLLKNSDFVTDVAYIDPPYGGGSTDYANMYQFLEEYIYSERIENIRHVKEYGKRFVNKKAYENNFIEMLSLLERFPVWVMSYNDSSWRDKDYIVNELKKHKKKVNVYEVENYMYNYRDNKKKNVGIEYIFIASN